MVSLTEITELISNNIEYAVLFLIINTFLLILLYIKISERRNLTLSKFINSRPVKALLAFTCMVYIFYALLLLLFYDEYPKIIQILPSLAELYSVFVGITLGFYWNKASEKVSTNIEANKIKHCLIDEIIENKKILDYLQNRGFMNHQHLPKTIMWEIYEEKINILKTIDIEELTAIYHNFFKIKHYVMNRSFIDSLSVDVDTYDAIIEQSSGDTQKLVNNWIEKKNNKEEK